MSPPSKLAVAAARMAVAERGLRTRRTASTEVVLSTAFGPASFTERLLRGHPRRRAGDGLARSCSPSAWPTPPRPRWPSPARPSGPNLTVTQREAGPLLAVGRGAAEVGRRVGGARAGGGVDEMPPLVHALLDRFDALAARRGRRRGGAAVRPAPERLPHGARGRRCWCSRTRTARGHAGRSDPRPHPRGWGSAFDPTASAGGLGPRPRAAGAGPARAARPRRPAPRATSTSSSPARRARWRGDRLEAETLHAAWGAAPLPPVLAPKAVTGEYGGGFLASAVLAAAGARVRAHRAASRARSGARRDRRTPAGPCPPPRSRPRHQPRRRRRRRRGWSWSGREPHRGRDPRLQAASSVGDGRAPHARASLPDVLVVDDGSRDGTADAAARARGGEVLTHPRQPGQGRRARRPRSRPCSAAASTRW